MSLHNDDDVQRGLLALFHRNAGYDRDHRDDVVAILLAVLPTYKKRVQAEARDDTIQRLVAVAKERQERVQELNLSPQLDPVGFYVSVFYVSMQKWLLGQATDALRADEVLEGNRTPADGRVEARPPHAIDPQPDDGDDIFHDPTGQWEQP